MWCTIMYHVIIQTVLVTPTVIAFKVHTFVKSFVSAAQTAKIGFLDAAVKLNAIPNSVPAFWLFENAIQTCALNVVLTNMMSQKSIAGMHLIHICFSFEKSTNIFSKKKLRININLVLFSEMSKFKEALEKGF